MPVSLDLLRKTLADLQPLGAGELPLLTMFSNVDAG